MTTIEQRLTTETSKFYTKYAHTLLQIWWQRVTFRAYPKNLTLSAYVPLDTVHKIVYHIYFYIFHGARAFNVPEPPPRRGSKIILRHTTRQNSSGWVIGPSQIPLPGDTQYLKTDRYPCPTGFESCNRPGMAHPPPALWRHGHVTNPLKHGSRLITCNWYENDLINMQTILLIPTRPWLICKLSNW